MAVLLTRMYNDLGANWHNYVYGFCGLLLVIALGVQHGSIPLPPTWAGVMEYLPFAIGVLNAFLPKAGAKT